MDNTRLLRLLKDVEPLIKSQIGSLNYRSYHYNYSEVYTMYEDKVIDITLKYHNKEYQDVLYITLASIRRHTYHIYRSFKRHSFTELEDNMTRDRSQVSIDKLFQVLKEKVYEDIDQVLHPILTLILTPPQDLVIGLPSGDKIPNQAYLNYMSIPVTQANLKTFQKHRNNINSIIRQTVLSISV